MPPPSNKRIYPPPPPMPQQQLPQGYLENTGEPVYGKVGEENMANYAEFSDPIQRLFYAILGAIPKPQEVTAGMQKFATTSPKQLGTQAIQAAERAYSKPGMKQHPVMATGEGFANTLLQFLGIPSESMAQRASTGDIAGVVGEGYGTYLAGKGLGEIGKRTGQFGRHAFNEYKDMQAADKAAWTDTDNPIDKVMQEKISEQDNFNKWLELSDLQWDKPANSYVPSLDGEWHTFLRNKYKQHLEDIEFYKGIDSKNQEKDPFGNQYDPFKGEGDNFDWKDWEETTPFRGGLYSSHRPQHKYGEQMLHEPKAGYPNPEDFNSLKEFSLRKMYGHILNSLYTGFNERAINRLKNTDPEFEKLSESIAAWKGSPRSIQELTGDILFGKNINSIQSHYEYPMARALADAYRNTPEVDYTLYRGITIGEHHDPTPYLQLKPGDKLPFFRLHGYTKSEKVADSFSSWNDKVIDYDEFGKKIEREPSWYSIKFVVEGPKKALNITHLNGFESEAEHLMNGEYVVKQVVQNGKKIKIIMQQERPLYAGQQETKPMGPSGAK